MLYAYDDGDKLLNVKVNGAVVKNFAYDLAGRTTGITTSAGTTTFTYDYESRATSVTGPGMLQTNVYNGLDTRVGSTTNSVANTYLRDGAYVTDAVLKDSTATFTPGVSERRGATTTFSHSGLKNADAQTGVSQAVNATQQYDAFGNLASSTGTWQGQFGYGGGFGYQQDATGLKLLGHRYYDASTGRFLTRDPIKDGRNWYVYVDSDPVSRFDNNGQDWKLVLSVPWQIVQNTFGYIGSWGGTNSYNAEAEAVLVKGSWLANLTNHHITLGHFVLSPNSGISDEILKHELGHRYQSNVLGPFYLLATAVGYYIGYLRAATWKAGDFFGALIRLDGKKALGLLHDASPLEADADAHSGVHRFIEENWVIAEHWL